MQHNFIEYNWRDHVPSLQPVDVALGAVVGLVLALSFLLEPFHLNSSRNGAAAAAQEAIGRSTPVPGLSGVPTGAPAAECSPKSHR